MFSGILYRIGFSYLVNTVKIPDSSCRWGSSWSVSQQRSPCGVCAPAGIVNIRFLCVDGSGSLWCFIADPPDSSLICPAFWPLSQHRYVIQKYNQLAQFPQQAWFKIKLFNFRKVNANAGKSNTVIYFNFAGMNFRVNPIFDHFAIF